MSFLVGLEKRAFNKKELSEMIEEHEKLIPILKSPDHQDDLKEAKKQQKELLSYRKQLRKMK